MALLWSPPSSTTLTLPPSRGQKKERLKRVQHDGARRTSNTLKGFSMKRGMLKQVQHDGARRTSNTLRGFPVKRGMLKRVQHDAVGKETNSLTGGFLTTLKTLK